MNSLRYLVSPGGDKLRKDAATSGPASSPPHSVRFARSAIKPDVRDHQLPLLWRLIVLFLSILHLPRPKASHDDMHIRKSKKPRANSSSSSLPPIPRLFDNRQRKTLVLDLDETLVHSMTRGHPRASQMVEVHLRNSPMASFYYVAKRPFCTDFLTAVLQWYDVAIFTASVSEYADPIIDLLEREVGWHCFKQRFYRDSCVPDGNGGYVKDLRVLNQDLSCILLLDNSPVSFAYQRRNGLAIEGWISDPSDRTLLQLLPLLFALRHTTDVRSILGLHDSKLISAN